MKKLYSLFLFAFVFSLPDLLAWGPQGHRIVASVAYQYLTPRARKHVDDVLGTRGIIYYSTWPDEIKNDTIYPTSYDWHFQNLSSGLSDSALIATQTDYPSHGGNLFRVTDSLTTLLTTDRTNHDALVFLVHFVGDRCCPTHVAHEDDKGGNMVKMKWFGRNTNLHTVWDTYLIEYVGFSYSEYATYLIDTYGHQRRQIEALSREDELRHTYGIISGIYNYQYDGNAYHYAYHWKDTLNYQLYLAGVKLAQVLNVLY